MELSCNWKVPDSGGVPLTTPSTWQPLGGSWPLVVNSDVCDRHDTKFCGPTFLPHALLYGVPGHTSFSVVGAPYQLPGTYVVWSIVGSTHVLLVNVMDQT